MGFLVVIGLAITGTIWFLEGLEILDIGVNIGELVGKASQRVIGDHAVGRDDESSGS